jgi:hypothetical protein
MFNQMDFMLMRERTKEINRELERLYVPMELDAQPGILKRAAAALREAANSVLRHRGSVAQSGLAGK